MRLFFLLFVAFLLLGNSGCPKAPEFHGKVYVGNSEGQSIDRAQENERIFCDEPKFDSCICLCGNDFQCFFDTFVTGCKTWRKDAGNTEACKTP